MFLREVPRQDVVRDTGHINPPLLDAPDSTESFVAVDSRSEVLSDDQERDGASVFEVVTLFKLMSPNRLS